MFAGALAAEGLPLHFRLRSRPRTDPATLRFYRRFEQLSVYGAASAGQPADADSTPAPAPFAFGPLPQGGSTVPTEFVSSGPPAE